MNESTQTEIMKDLVKSTKRIRETNHITTDEVNDILGVENICEEIEANEWHINGTAITGYQLITYLAIVNARLMVFNNAPEEEIKENRELDSRNMVEDFYKSLGDILRPKI